MISHSWRASPGRLDDRLGQYCMKGVVKKPRNGSGKSSRSSNVVDGQDEVGVAGRSR